MRQFEVLIWIIWQRLADDEDQQARWLLLIGWAHRNHVQENTMTTLPGQSAPNVVPTVPAATSDVAIGMVRAERRMRAGRDRCAVRVAVH